MTRFSEHLSDASVPYVFGVNLSVIGLVSVAEVESVLKCAVLAATLTLTCISAWLKWRNRDKPGA